MTTTLMSLCVCGFYSFHRRKHSKHPWPLGTDNMAIRGVDNSIQLYSKLDLNPHSATALIAHQRT